MANHGISGKVLGWIRSWLAGRTQRVCVNGVFSAWCLVLSGVPQGSVLGPILFLTFINDLDLNIHNLLFKFADDTKLCAKISTKEDSEKLQEDLNSVVTVSKYFLSVGFGRFCRKNLGFRFGLGFHDKRIVNFFMTRVIWHDSSSLVRMINSRIHCQ